MVICICTLLSHLLLLINVSQIKLFPDRIRSYKGAHSSSSEHLLIFRDKSCISKRLADKMSDFVSTIHLIIFSCQRLEIFLQIQVEGILVFLIVSLFGIHTFRKSWPLSDLSVFDIMWHPLMLLEIEKDNFWYWGAFFATIKETGRNIGQHILHWNDYTRMGDVMKHLFSSKNQLFPFIGRS